MQAPQMPACRHLTCRRGPRPFVAKMTASSCYPHCCHLAALQVDIMAQVQCKKRTHAMLPHACYRHLAVSMVVKVAVTHRGNAIATRWLLGGRSTGHQADSLSALGKLYHAWQLVGKNERPWGFRAYLASVAAGQAAQALHQMRGAAQATAAGERCSAAGPAPCCHPEASPVRSWPETSCCQGCACQPPAGQSRGLCHPAQRRLAPRAARWPLLRSTREAATPQRLG